MSVDIPFLQEFKLPLLTGRKTMTARTRQWAKAGETFHAFGAVFLLLRVRLVPLKYVAESCYYSEGFSNPMEFIACWKRIHPRAGYQPAREVYLHEFKRKGDLI